MKLRKKMLEKEKMKIKIISFRKYGEPKLKKLAELKGIKPVNSAVWIHKKCSCPVFVVGNDVYIHHKDFFSEIFQSPEIGLSLNQEIEKYFPEIKRKSEKFIYEDNWGSIVLRNEAWLKIEDSVNEPVIVNQVQTWWHRCTVSLFELFNENWYERNDYCEWSRFFENVWNCLKK